MSGVVGLINKSRKGAKYFNSTKILIVGPSGCGKTTLAINLAINNISPYSNVIYVSPESSADDSIIVNFKEWLKKAGIPFFHCLVNGNSLQIPKIGNALFIIDDYYTSTGRPPILEKLIKTLLNRGRHDNNHILYLAQCASRLQPEMKQNNNGVYLKSREIAFNVFNIPLERLPYIDESEWNLIKPNQDIKFVKTIHIPPIKTIAEVVKKLKSKIKVKQKDISTNVEYGEIDEQAKGAIDKPKPSKAPIIKKIKQQQSKLTSLPITNSKINDKCGMMDNDNNFMMHRLGMF